MGVDFLGRFQGHVLPRLALAHALMFELHRFHLLGEIRRVAVEVDRVAHAEDLREHQHGDSDVVEVVGHFSDLMFGHGRLPNIVLR